MKVSRIPCNIINLKNKVAEKNPLALIIIPLFYFMIFFAVLDQEYTWTGTGESNGSLWILLLTFFPFMALKSLWGLSHPVVLSLLLFLNLLLLTVLLYILCGWLSGKQGSKNT